MSKYSSIVHSLRDAVDRKDIDAIMEHFHPELTYINSLNRKLNKQELRDEYLSAFNRFPDVAYDIKRIITEGDTVVVEINYHFTHNVDYGNIKATGRYIEFPAVFVYMMENSKIKQFQLYYNLRLMEQLMTNP